MLTLVKAFKKPPFKIEEQGWGEFDMAIVLHYVDRGGEVTISHDLNFLESRYENTHVLVRAEIYIYVYKLECIADYLHSRNLPILNQVLRKHCWRLDLFRVCLQGIKRVLWRTRRKENMMVMKGARRNRNRSGLVNK